MSVDVLQDKIRKRKNPIVLDLTLLPEQIPPQLREGRSDAEAYGLFSRELIGCMKGILPGVRISFAAFALMGAEGIRQLQQTLQAAKETGLYVLLDAPEISSPTAAQIAANALLDKPSEFPCDGLVISGYLGSDAIRPFLPFCKDNKKSVFVLARTANKSAPELQDLIAGTRLVHLAAADYANRQGSSLVGKVGILRLGLLRRQLHLRAFRPSGGNILPSSFWWRAWTIPAAIPKTVPLALTNSVMAVRFALVRQSPVHGSRTMRHRII